MSKAKRLTKRQLAVIDDLFSGKFDEQTVLEKHKVSRNVYNKWVLDKLFDAEVSRRISYAYRQSQSLIARYACFAAAKLIELTESEKEETARKACLDIISLPQAAAKKPQGPSETEPAGEQEQPQLSDETVSRLLAVLAEEKKENTK